MMRPLLRAQSVNRSARNWIMLRLMLSLATLAALGSTAMAASSATETLVFPVFEERLNLTSSTRVGMLVDGFSFEQDGRVDLVATGVITSPYGYTEVAANATLFHLMVCTADEYAAMVPSSEQLPQPGAVVSHACSWAVSEGCRVTVPFNSHSVVGDGKSVRSSLQFRRIFKYSVSDEQEQLMYFVLANCALPSGAYPNTAVFVDVSYTFWNPDSKYLSATETAYLPLSLSLAVAWIVGVCAWLFLMHRRSSFSNALHVRLLTAPLWKCVHLVCTFVYWYAKSQGMQNADLQFAIDPFKFITHACFMAFLLHSVLLIAKGWKICTPVISRIEKRNASIVIAAYLFGRTTFYFWSTFAAAALLSALVLTISFVLLIYAIWNSFRMTMQSLYQQANLAATYMPPLRALVHAKFMAIRGIRHSFVALLLSWVVIDVVGRSPMFAETMPWLGFLLNQSVDLAFLLGVAVALRPRDPVAVLTAGPAGRQLRERLAGRRATASQRAGAAAVAPTAQLFTLAVLQPDKSLALAEVECMEDMLPPPPPPPACEESAGEEAGAGTGAGSAAAGSARQRGARHGSDADDGNSTVFVEMAALGSHAGSRSGYHSLRRSSRLADTGSSSSSSSGVAAPGSGSGPGQGPSAAEGNLQDHEDHPSGRTLTGAASTSSLILDMTRPSSAEQRRAASHVVSDGAKRSGTGASNGRDNDDGGDDDSSSMSSTEERLVTGHASFRQQPNPMADLGDSDDSDDEDHDDDDDEHPVPIMEVPAAAAAIIGTRRHPHS